MPLARRHLLVVATFWLSVLLYVDRACISAAKDLISRDLRLSDTQMGWAMSAFALGYAVCQTPAGMLADRWGPRRVLTAIVVLWSIFTGLTGAAWNLVSLVVTRFLFGAGEAGAFPGMAKAVYAWIPTGERGLVQGINFSGARLGAAFAMPLIAGTVQAFGWRNTFVALMAIGFVWAVGWYVWFRDDPGENPRISPEELETILAGRRPPVVDALPVAHTSLLASPALWLLCAQYFASNFTFFFCLTWLFPHLKDTYALGGVEAGWYAAGPLVGGAFGNWVSGWWVDRLYRVGKFTASRRLPAMLGFSLAAIGLVMGADATTAAASMGWFALAVFGADMTLSPSWTACIDIGGRRAGTVSGTMNMAGNIGSFLTALAFPYLAAWTQSNEPFFYLAAGLNAASVLVWTLIDPRRRIGGAE